MLQETAQEKTTKKILLYGNSILIAGLTAKLEQVHGLDVAQAEGEGDLGNLSKLDMIVVDLRDNRASQILPRLSAAPNVLLVGMDALTNTLTVLTSQTRPAHSMQDVLEALKEAM